MAGTKTSALAALSALADDDLIAAVDVSDTTMAPTGTTKRTTAAAIADYTSKATAPYVDPRWFGAVGLDVVADSAGFQAAIDFPSEAEVVVPVGDWYAEGLVPRSGLKLRGSGMASHLRATTTDLFDVSANVVALSIGDVALTSEVGAGHIFNFGTGVYMTLSQIERCTITQHNDAKSVVNMPDGEWIDNVVYGGNITHTATATVPTFYMVSSTNAINSNTWERLRFTYSGNYNIWIESTGAGTCFDNSIRDINFEVSVGGCVKMLSCQNTELEQCSVYDLQAVGPAQRDLFYLGKGTSGAVSSRNTLISVTRRGGSLAGGVNDVKMVAAEVQTTVLINCNQSGSSGLVRDFGGTPATDIGFGAGNATNDSRVNYITADVVRTGRNTTGNRPSASVVGAGAMWYDTTLTRPIWSDGTNWKQAVGPASGAYTQTFSTADKTHAARTAAALTDSTGGTPGTTIAAIANPADTPADADALRDDLVANALPAIRNAIASLADQINKLRTDCVDSASLLNSVVDDLQTLGLVT